ncbi:MAG: hypothetical protein AB7D16_10910 [Eubacteriaceae bacterium]
MSDEATNTTCYHGTSSEKARNIFDFGFTSKTVKIQDLKNDLLSKFPCDLGNGIYFYIDVEEKGFDGLKNACNYVQAFKKNEIEYSIIKATISLDPGDKGLNLNDEKFLNSFLKFRSHFLERLDALIESHEKLQKYSKKDKALARGNCDGIFIEMYIDALQLKPVFVLKDTFTKFNPKYKISSFPNGREVAVREERIVKDKEIFKVFKREM